MSELTARPTATPRWNTRIVFGGAILLVLALFAILGVRLLQVGEPALASGGAPAFEMRTFDGKTLSLSDLHGKPVVLNFWASWCQPCREEAPVLQSAWEQYRTQGLTIVGVDYVDTESEALKFLAAFKVTYPNGPDLRSSISQAYRITGVPETYFITRDGRLLSGVDATGRPYANWIGPISQQALEERIEKLLAP